MRDLPSMLTIIMILRLTCSFLLYQFTACLASPVDAMTLVPANDYDDENDDNQTQLTASCLELQCPELRCQKVIQKEGECCKSCDISGSYSSQNASCNNWTSLHF